jgi:hypothetical protein
LAFKWTDEQVVFLQCDDPSLRVKAFAGAAKTSTLVGYTKARPQTKFLYLAYNKSVAEEARERFPKNVTCMTTHGIAYRIVGIKYKHKLAGSLRLADVGQVIGSSNWGFIKQVVETLNGFLVSADEFVTAAHIPKKAYEYAMNQKASYLDGLFKAVELLWSKMIDPEDREVSCLHDGYLKVYSLSNPDLSQYDCILVDEAQDTNSVTSAIVLKQKSVQRIWVGDPHQSIYKFRGADNALDHPELKGSTDLFLSQSFRFGPAVALVANKLLAFKGETRQVIGSGAPTQIKLSLDEDASRPTYIHRTVMGVIDKAIELTGQGKKVYWVGGVEAYSIGDIEDLQRLSKNQTSDVKNKRLLSEYGDINSYMDMATETHDPEMKRAVKILKNYKDLSSRLQQVRKMTVKTESDADFVVTTAHRCKGLEWDNVVMGDDFPDPLDRDMDIDDKAQEINLLYVSVTRAKLAIAINSIVIGMLREHTVRTKGGMKLQIT